jgi:hypothetical protein
MSQFQLVRGGIFRACGHYRRISIPVMSNQVANLQSPSQLLGEPSAAGEKEGGRACRSHNYLTAKQV